MRTSPEMEHRVAGRGLAIFRKLVLWSIGVLLAITGAFALMYVPFGGGLASLIVAVILLWPAVRLIGKARKS